MHDCLIDHVEWTEAGIWLFFEDGFNVTKDNSRIILDVTSLVENGGLFERRAYLEGFWKFEGVPFRDQIIQNQFPYQRF